MKARVCEGERGELFEPPVVGALSGVVSRKMKLNFKIIRIHTMSLGPGRSGILRQTLVNTPTPILCTPQYFAHNPSHSPTMTANTPARAAWWPADAIPLADGSRPRIYTPDGELEVVFPLPLLLDNCARWLPDVAYANEHERVRPPPAPRRAAR